MNKNKDVIDLINFVQKTRDSLGALLDDAPKGFTFDEVQKIGGSIDALDSFIRSVRPRG